MRGPRVCLLVGAVLLSLIPCQAVVNNMRTEKHRDVPPPPPLKKAIKLGDWNFEDRTESMRKNYKGPWLIMFHMPWCHHCKEMLPVFDTLAEDLKTEMSVATVNLEVNKKVKYRFRKLVQGYPTIVVLENGRLYAFPEATRDLVELLRFARNGFRANAHDAQAPIPPDPESLPLKERAKMVAEDFIDSVNKGYSNIWRDHKHELIAALSMAFSLGAIFGFLVKAFIDAMLPPKPRPTRKVLRVVKKQGLQPGPGVEKPHAQ